jgi:S-adenosyl-L-methionine hydrolase (adenosine-forming)
MGPPGRRRSSGADEHRQDDRSQAVYFLSDYGTDDEFVGVVHVVLHRLAPSVPVIDLGHRVPPFDIAAGAAALVRCAPYLGAGVVLAVVDPGVGTGRRGVAVEVAGAGPRWLVGPDNGLLEPLARTLGGADRVVELRPGALRPTWWLAQPEGRTFDGRDLFAPAAAHLAVGVPASELGRDADPESLVPLVTDRAPGVAPDGARTIDVPVTWIDRFGNVQLGAGAAELDAIGLITGGTASVAVPGPVPAVDPAPSERAQSEPGLSGWALSGWASSGRARRVDAFAALGDGELGLMIDGNGRVALVLREASAARRLLLGAGDIVRIGVPDDIGG